MSVVEAVLQTLKTLRFDTPTAPSNTTDSEYENLEISERLRVFHTLPTLASNLGPVNTREKLIPTISDVVSNAIDADDDEVLMVIAQKLGSFGDLVGGADHVSLIVPILANIIYSIEEVVVSEAACDSLVALLPKLPNDVVDSTFAPIIRHIIEEDLYCASRKVVTKLIIACYPLVSTRNQVDFKYRLFHLADSEDEVPLVRAAAVQQLVPLARFAGSDLKSELGLLIASLVSDNQRVVRAACLPPLVELGRMITDAAEFESTVRPCIDKLAGDPSRDVRRGMATVITNLQTLVCNHGGASRSLHQIMLNLLEDNETETRRISAGQFKDFCLASPKDILVTILLPRLRERLSMEREERVRSELVRCAVGLLPSINREDCLPLVQHILAFLNDTCSQSKQYVFEHFSELVALMPANEIQLTLLPSLLRLWQDKNWRVRLGVVQSVPCLYDKLPDNCLQETVLPANLAWLRDPAWCVRECACRSLARLLVACPGACKKAFNGVGSKSSTNSNSGNVTSSNSSNTSSNTINPISSSGTNASNSSTGSLSGSTNPQAATDQLNSSSLSTLNASNTSVNPANALTTQAAAGGLKALAVDTNYHLRQIYINVIQAIWGPGILDEPPYSALGDDPSAGILFPASRNIYAYLSTKTKNSTNSNNLCVTAVPKGCQAPPQIPNVYLTGCVAQLLRFLSEDVVPNVRICATQALHIISGSLDRKTIQNDVIPVLKKVIDYDFDQDVRFFAQQTLTFFSSLPST
ncbi:Serine/threonine-protein phosphatase 2A 65 kDa regulatory subunit A alpha isoform [Schistosoma japonicum]|uniref:Serine/threonine-protein phosphatase 2A 65 kDa regulatory subunit A alpha isoform n=1 Tax=Schistosoma japonicum TaxID=6182 RepID=A0A4Z2DVR9_SCHJA|nr:Serine/threonine-protein phosphatase 2A 65 kDa regulatory subunit A alpha isoform [Schistosoma japonicum]